MSETYSLEAYLKASDQGFISMMKNASSSTEQLDKSVGKAQTSIADIAKGVGAFKLVESGLGIMKDSMDAAISRFDIMQGFPKVLGAIGFSSEDSSKAVSKLGDGIDGLPTKLDDVVSKTQRMAAITKNLDKSTDATLALNNAMLASGANTEQASRGTDQYIKMLSTGKVELESWKTLQETMPIGLQLTAEAMGYVGESAQNDLYSALQSGEVVFSDFQNQLIDLGTGTGQLAELAKTNSEGIATSFSNLRNTASKGLANIITELDTLSTSVTGKNIAQNLDGMKVAVNNSFKAVVSTIKASTPVVQFFGTVIGGTAKTASALSPVLFGLAAGFGALKVVNGLNSMMAKTDAIFMAAGMSGKALTITTQAHLAAQVANTTATKADIAIKAAQNGQVTLGASLFGVLTGSVSASTVATTLASAATATFSTALKVAMGPIGWIVGGIGLLVAGASALWKWWNKNSDEVEKLNGEQEKLTDTTKTLVETVDDESERHKESIKAIDNKSKAYADLVDTSEKLARKNSRTAADTKILKANIEQLNDSVDGLGLSFDKENGVLSQNTEQIKKRIEAQANQDKANLAMEESIRLSERQHEIDAQLGDITAMRDAWNKKVEEGTGNFIEDSKVKRQAKEATEELDEQEQLLMVTKDALASSITENNAVMQASNEAYTQAVENGVTRQVTTYEMLSAEQQRAVDGMKQTFDNLTQAATNAFSKISTESSISLGEMLENLQHNQEAVRQWGENQAALLEWAGQNGYDSFIPFIENIGVDQAGVLAQMATAINGSNEEQAGLLAQMAQTYETGFGTAVQAGKKSMGEEFSTLNSDIQAMILPAMQTVNTDVQALFEEFGGNVAQGASAGIKNGAGEVKGASEELAKQTADGFSGPLGIHSPSRVFTDFGKNITEGANNGIVSGTGQVVSTTSNLANRIKIPFMPLPGQMQTIGSQISAGLAVGITANAGSAIAAAQAIANRVKSTIQSAMDVHSPSRFTAWIGKNMMIGLGDGMVDYAKYALNSASSVVSDVQEQFSPESFDLSGQIATANSGLVANINSDNNFNSNVTYSFTSVVEVDGRELAKGTSTYTEAELKKREARRVRNEENF